MNVTDLTTSRLSQYVTFPMNPWFYMPQLPRLGETAALDAREARHACSSRRLNVGDMVCVFDGAGNVADAALTRVTTREVVLEVKHVQQQAPSRPHLHLAASLPKGDRQSVMLSMATQLGMSAFTPLMCARGVARPGKSFFERTRRIFIESCKQSRRAHLPAIHEPADVQRVVSCAKARSETVIIAHPGGEPAGMLRRALGDVQHVVFLVGPEGGFTDEEIAAGKESGGRIVSLGEGVLRVETAAAALLAVFSIV